MMNMARLKIHHLLQVLRTYRDPLGLPRAMPLPLTPLTLLPRVAPPLPPLDETSPALRLLSPDVGRAAGAGVANLVESREEGGLSTKEVSVVIKVSSLKSGRETWSAAGPRSSVCFERLKDSDTGACRRPFSASAT